MLTLIITTYLVCFWTTKVSCDHPPVFYIEGDGWHNQTHAGYVGHFKITLDVEISSWWYALIYPQPIAEIEVWQGVYYRSSEDRRILYVKNKRWNKKKRPGAMLDQRYLVSFEILPNANCNDDDNYFGPRPTIVFLHKAYEPDACNNTEHEMTAYNIDSFSLPDYFEMFPVNIVTTTTEATASTLALTKGPNSGPLWWVRTRSPRLTSTTTRETLRSTATTTTTPTKPITTTLLIISESCTASIPKWSNRCKKRGKQGWQCYIPQCYNQSPTRYRAIQCWKYRGVCWCANPITGIRKNTILVRFKNRYKLRCFDEPTTTSAATTSTRPTRPSNLAGLARPAFKPKRNYNYNLVMHNSLLFYAAQRSGDIGDNGRIYWRRSAHVNDGSDCRPSLDLSGGYYVSGDYIKYGFPMASAMTVLAWGFLEFKDAYELNSQTQFMKNALEWGADYFMKAHTSRNTLVGQVGDATLENSYWLRPQDMTVRRPCYTITETNPGSDLAAETAAALAATAKVWMITGSAHNDSYVTSLLRHARELYNFANTFRGLYSFSIRKAKDHYQSKSYYDELAWAALWLHEATGENQYLAYAGRLYKNYRLDTPQREFSWETKTVAVQLLLSKYAHRAGAVNAAQIYLTPLTEFCNYNQPGGGALYTPQGLLYHNNWGPTRYASNAAFVCIVASKLPALDSRLKLSYRQFAENQIDYILGKTGRSFIVGYGRQYPKRPHHRASSCGLSGSCGWAALYRNAANPLSLQGALIGGPDHLDAYIDDRANFTTNSVALDYNAGFQGAVAGLKHFQIEYDKYR